MRLLETEFQSAGRQTPVPCVASSGKTTRRLLRLSDRRRPRLVKLRFPTPSISMCGSVKLAWALKRVLDMVRTPRQNMIP